MATTHVFIVDEQTFPIHLKYMFAGTGPGNVKNNEETGSSQSSESKTASDFNIDDEGKGNRKGHVNFSLLSDISRCRIGDFVIFYLQAKALFFGVFKVKSDPYINKNSDDESRKLSEQLKLLLPFRVDIEPDKVYPKGITEWELLDSISDIDAPYKMQWSLIYRKLKGRRGCTMITLYESERLVHKLSVFNENNSIADSSKLTYNAQDSTIVKGENNLQLPSERYVFDFIHKIIDKDKKKLSYEILLQGFILQNIGRGEVKALDEVFLQNKSLNWIGNEVICSVGNQAMDILLDSSDNNGNRTIIPIEIKDELVEPDALQQISKYIRWLKEYYIPNIEEGTPKIEAIILSLKETAVNGNRIPNRKGYLDFKKLLDSRNDQFDNCIKIRHVVYSMKDNNIEFQNMP